MFWFGCARIWILIMAIHCWLDHRLFISVPHAHLVRQSRAPILFARRLAFGRALPRELLLGDATLGGGASTLLLGRAALAHNVGRETAADVDLERRGWAGSGKRKKEA